MQRTDVPPQIPKTMDEDVLRPFFSQFGALSDISIIRDKASDAHKGCAFVTYVRRSDAVSAITNLHDRVKLESVRTLSVPSACTHILASSHISPFSSPLSLYPLVP